MTKDNGVKSTIIGFREWVSLSDLRIDAIKAKVDTGAKTSSLHASNIKIKKSGGKLYVYFTIHLLQDKNSPTLNCKALFVEKRIVTDSGGHKEERIVIRTNLVLGEFKQEIDVTLTDRSTMKYRMLIGRSALNQFYIDPSQSYLTGKSIRQRRFLKDLKNPSGKKSEKSRRTSSLV